MSINQQIQQFQAAQEAANQAQEDILKRLDKSAEIIRNIVRKRNYGEYVPASLAWVSVYRKKASKGWGANPKPTHAAEITFTGNEFAPLEVKYDGQTYRIDRELIFGSTWDIAKATRKRLYEHRNSKWVAEHRELKRKVDTFETARDAKIAEIRKNAEREIKKLMEGSSAEDARNLDKLTRQMTNYNARIQAQTARKEAKKAKKAEEAS